MRKPWLLPVVAWLCTYRPLHWCTIELIKYIKDIELILDLRVSIRCAISLK